MPRSGRHRVQGLVHGREGLKGDVIDEQVLGSGHGVLRSEMERTPTTPPTGRTGSTMAAGHRADARLVVYAVRTVGEAWKASSPLPQSQAGLPVSRRRPPVSGTNRRSNAQIEDDSGTRTGRAADGLGIAEHEPQTLPLSPLAASPDARRASSPHPTPCDGLPVSRRATFALNVGEYGLVICLSVPPQGVQEAGENNPGSWGRSKTWTVCPVRTHTRRGSGLVLASRRPWRAWGVGRGAWGGRDPGRTQTRPGRPAAATSRSGSASPRPP